MFPQRKSLERNASRKLHVGRRCHDTWIAFCAIPGNSCEILLVGCRCSKRGGQRREVGQRLEAEIGHVMRILTAKASIFFKALGFNGYHWGDRVGIVVVGVI